MSDSAGTSVATRSTHITAAGRDQRLFFSLWFSSLWWEFGSVWFVTGIPAAVEPVQMPTWHQGPLTAPGTFAARGLS